MAAIFDAIKFPKGDSFKFRPEDAVFSGFTGRKVRTANMVQKMAISLLLRQIHEIGVRKGQGGKLDGKPIVIYGHTRVLGGRLINQIIGLLNKGKTDAQIIETLKYNEENVKFVGILEENVDLIEQVRQFNAVAQGQPFVLRATYFKIGDEKEAAILTLLENDEGTRNAVDKVAQAENIEFMHQTWGWSYADIAKKLGKRAPEITALLKVLELDGDTQLQVASGKIKLDTAVNTVAVIEPSQRKAVLDKAAADNGGELTATTIANAARELGVDTSKALKRTDAEAKKLLDELIDSTTVGPLQALLFGLKDFRAGVIDGTEVKALRDALQSAIDGQSVTTAAA